jgi:L-rhamnose-H+ transport protein
VFGTLMPPIFDGQFGQILHEPSGQVTLLGVALCVAGIAISGLAGRSKERELTAEQKQATVQEFNFVKGILVATCSGILSAAFAYGLDAGKPISALAKASLVTHNRADLWQNLPVLIVVLLGGFTTNFVWCVMLNFKNKTGGQYFSATAQGNFPGREQETIIETAPDAPGEEMAAQIPSEHHTAPQSETNVPLLANYFFCALAGVTWYMQFFFYGMGTTKMGRYDFSSWTLHMASIIIFSTLWGIALREWKGASKKTHVLIGIGLAVLIFSTVVVGFGNWMKATAVH